MARRASPDNCERCGAPFRRKYLKKGVRKRFCSPECAAQSRPRDEDRMLNLICATCGKEFRRYISLSPGRVHYCSRKCRNTRSPRACRSCGKAFMAPAHEIKAGKALFCSLRCTNIGTRHLREPMRLASVVGIPAHNNRQVLRHCQHCDRAFLSSPSAAPKFCSNACRWEAQRTLTSRGQYIRITVDGRRVYEHRHVMEMIIGRPLRSDEQVDHINRNREDNRPENLRILTPAEHGRVSSRARGTEPSFSSASRASLVYRLAVARR